MRRSVYLLPIMVLMLVCQIAWGYWPEEWGERLRTVLPRVKQLVQEEDAPSLAAMLAAELALPISQRTPPLQNVLVWELINAGDHTALPVLDGLLQGRDSYLERVTEPSEALAIVATARIRNRDRTESEMVTILQSLYAGRNKLPNHIARSAFDAGIAHAIARLDIEQVPTELEQGYWYGIEALRRTVNHLPTETQIGTLVRFLERTQQDPRRAQYAMYLLVELGQPALKPLMAAIADADYHSEPAVGTPRFAEYAHFVDAVASIASSQDLPDVEILIRGLSGQFPRLQQMRQDIRSGARIPHEYSRILSFR